MAKRVFESTCDHNLIGEIKEDGSFHIYSANDWTAQITIEKENDLFRLADQLTLAGMAMMQERSK